MTSFERAKDEREKALNFTDQIALLEGRGPTPPSSVQQETRSRRIAKQRIRRMPGQVLTDAPDVLHRC